MADFNIFTANGVDYNCKDATARSGLSTANSNIATLQGNVTTLQGKMTTAEGDIDNLESAMTTAQGNITALQTQANNLQGQLGDLFVVNGTNISYTSGETWLNKVQRAVAQEAIPVGKPFVGYFISAARYSVSGFLYIVDNALYGSIWVSSFMGFRVYKVDAGVYTETILA